MSPSGARVHVLVGICPHGWIERVSIKCPCTCVSRFFAYMGGLRGCQAGARVHVL